MSWHCIIIADNERRDARAAAFIHALRRAYRQAGAPAQATAFINRGSASRFTFLLSPETSTLADALLQRYDALACARAPALTRYAPLPL